MSGATQSEVRSHRKKIYRTIFVIACVLVVLAVLFWPLELDVYWARGEVLQLSWNEEPAVSTETAASWSYFSLQPVAYLSLVTAVVSFLLYRHEAEKAL